MRRSTFLPLLLLLLSPTAARSAQEDPLAFLAEARKKHVDLGAQGLRSFSAAMTLRRSEDENLSRTRELASFGYAWTTPDEEKFDFEKTHENLEKPLRDAVRDLWRDVTGALWFDLLEKTTDLRIEAGDGVTVVAGTAVGLGEIRASFEEGTGKQVEFEVVSIKAKIAYFYIREKGGLRVSWREVSVNGAWVFRTTYDAFRSVSGFRLPTVLNLQSEKNTTEFGIEYESVNGDPALVEELDEAAVKALVKAFEKEWRGWTEGQRIGETRALANTPHELASAAIAKLGLRDRSPDVRQEAAVSLGIMKQRNVVPALIAAMKKNEKEIKVYLKVIQALGEIGDPRAVDVLSKDWWNQRIGEYGVAAARAKISALGNVRHVSSVDALIDTFFITKDETISLLKADLAFSLEKLTDQKFLYDRRAWKDWWKKNRTKHRFD